ncbi:MAG: hypothetical protein Q9218_002962 [Villophora microphyllina]
MAFQQPIVAPSRPPLTVFEAKQSSPPTPLTQQAPSEKSREWVLFPNTRARSHTQTPTTTFSPQTAGLSRLSEFGSLGTAAPHDHNIDYDDALEDDEELDSLDEGLHAFHEHLADQGSMDFYQDGSILPTHDGLGTFPASSHPVQEHLWHFERFNPRRRSLGHHRRRSSVQRRLDTLEVHDELQMEKQRTDRIERWRIDHSNFLLEEVEKETRRTMSRHHEHWGASSYNVAIEDRRRNAVALSTALERTTVPISERDPGNFEDTPNAWDHIIQRLVQDLLGVDDMKLAIISGEALITEGGQLQFDRSTQGSKPSIRSFVTQSIPIRNLTLLNQLSQELLSALRRYSYAPITVGSLVNPVNLDYAGLPVNEPYHQQQSAVPIPTQPELPEAENELNPGPQFKPTLKDHNCPASPTADSKHAALWGIEEEPERQSTTIQDLDYWQQTPSIRMVFRILHQHFTARRRPLLTTNTLASNKPSNVATTSTADSMRRAAVIRKHHPLISSSQQTKRNSRPYSSHGIRHLASPFLRRSESSCASISARHNRRGSGSSRNYWDLGGSIGSGSVGGIGVWGEV